MTSEPSVQGQWIDLRAADGGRFGGYLCRPPSGRGPGLLLIQEIFGVNAHIRAVAEQYALDGYTVLAPDVYWREQPRVDLGYDAQSFQTALGFMRRADFAQVVQDLDTALGALRERAECTGPAAVLGYCMGGRLAFHVAAQTDVDAAVCYYGGGIHNVLDQAPRIRCPILLHFAESDTMIPPAAVQATQEALAFHRDAHVVLHAGVDHGFNCWARSVYDQRAAARARGQTLAFLAERLG